ncbi:MAG: FtsW/RodA/SpoVE family cell cycle protein, partial [Patescibacteria group bacterium]
MKKINLKNFWSEAKYFFRGVIKGQDNPPDWTLIGTIFFLTIFGLIMLSSAAVALGFERYGDSYWNVKHQILFGLIPGIALFIFFSRFDYYKLKRLAIFFLLGTIALLILVFIPGIGADWGTSRSWINFFGFSLQPSEIVKLTFLLYMVSWLSSRESRHLKNLQSGFLPFVFILAIVVLLLILQPDTGTMMIIAVTS